MTHEEWCVETLMRKLIPRFPLVDGGVLDNGCIMTFHARTWVLNMVGFWAIAMQRMNFGVWLSDQDDSRGFHVLLRGESKMFSMTEAKLNRVLIWTGGSGDLRIPLAIHKESLAWYMSPGEAISCSGCLNILNQLVEPWRRYPAHEITELSFARRRMWFYAMSRSLKCLTE